jgi:HSP20 family protein
MGILRRDGNDQRQRRNDQNALTRSEQPQLVRDRDQMPMRDPFQMMARDPFQLMREMMIDPYRVFQQMAPWSDIGREGRELMWNPSFDIRETDDAFLFKADMPGVRQEDLDISLAGNNLSISGKRERDVEQDEGTVHTYERSYGQFMRSFTLPESADLDQVRCDLKDGVLNLVVPKRAGSTPQRRKIQIGSGSKA